ncbi:unnamed protein product [Parajaminaea phylloscopi]
MSASAQAAAGVASHTSEGDTSVVSEAQRPRSYLLPYSTLQPTYTQVFEDVATRKIISEEAWLSVYAENAPQKSIHATLQLSSVAGDDERTSDRVNVQHTKGGQSILRVKQHDGDGAVAASHSNARDLLLETNSTNAAATRPDKLQNAPTLSHPVRLRLPSRTRSAVLKGNRSLGAQARGAGGTISAFDVSPDGSKFVAGGEDGEVVVGELPLPAPPGARSPQPASSAATQSIEARARARMAENEERRRQTASVPLKGHLGDLRSAQFFPSGQVVLTAASDLTLRLYSLAGLNARTFRGHKRAITCSAMIGKGKRFLSGSLDGTLRLWDVASERCLRTMAVRNMSGVESMAMLPIVGHTQVEAEEDGTGRYLVFAGLSSGWIDVFSVKISVQEPARAAVVDAQGNEEEPARAAQLSIQDYRLLSIAPIEYPTDLPVSTSQTPTGPAASDHWAIVPSGAVWSLDAMIVKGAAQAPSTLHIAAGTKNGLIRLFEPDVPALAALADAKEAAEMDGTLEVQEHRERLEALAVRETLNIRRNPAGVNALRFVPQGAVGDHKRPPDVVVATSDGTPWRLAFVAEALPETTSSEQTSDAVWIPYVKEEYTGWEAGDSVECIAFAPTAQSGDGGTAGIYSPRVVLAGAEGMIVTYLS